MRSPTTLLLTMIASLLLVAACDDQSEEASSCRYYIQQDLDNQDYDSALARLTDETCQDTYPDNEYLVDQASAYLGKAGFTFTDILGAALEGSENEGEDSDALTSFTSAIGDLTSDESIANLELAQAKYEAYLGQSCNDLGSNKTTSEDGICLVQGVLSLSQTAIALDFLAGSNGELTEDNEALDLSACALSYSVTGDDSNCPSGTSVITTTSVTFSYSGDLPDQSYIQLEVVGGGNTDYFLQTDTVETIESIVFTDGYCTNDFSLSVDTFDDIPSDGNLYYACPSESGTDQSVNDFVVTALNDAIKNIESLVDTFGASEEEANDIQEAIDDFKADIIGCDLDSPSGPEACTSEQRDQFDEDFEIADIIDYLTDLDTE